MKLFDLAYKLTDRLLRGVQSTDRVKPDRKSNETDREKIF